MRRWDVLIAAACVVLAACVGDGDFFGDDPGELRESREAEQRDQVVDADLPAAQVRAEYEGALSTELMQWVDLAWDDVYFEGRGLCWSCGPWGLGCTNYCESTESGLDPELLAELDADLDDTGCVGVGLDGPARVWCLLDHQFDTHDRIPDLDFEEWRAFMDLQCGR